MKRVLTLLAIPDGIELEAYQAVIVCREAFGEFTI